MRLPALAFNEYEAIKFRKYWVVEKHLEIDFAPLSVWWGNVENIDESKIIFASALSEFQNHVIWN